MKKISILFSFILIALTVIAPINAQCREHTPEDNVLADKITLLSSLGIIPKDTTVEECDEYITRREAFIIACRARGWYYYGDDKTISDAMWDAITEAGCMVYYGEYENPFSDISEDDKDYATMLTCYFYNILKGTQKYRGIKITADLESILTVGAMQRIARRIPRRLADYKYGYLDASPVKKSEYLESVYDALYVIYDDYRYGYIRLSKPIDDLINIKWASEN